MSTQNHRKKGFKTVKPEGQMQIKNSMLERKKKFVCVFALTFDVDFFQTHENHVFLLFINQQIIKSAKDQNPEEL